jgi:hypothetical protein
MKDRRRWVLHKRYGLTKKRTKLLVLQHCIRGGPQMRLTKNVGMLLLAIWLILASLVSLFHLSFAGMALIMGIIALVAGIFILVGR